MTTPIESVVESVDRRMPTRQATMHDIHWLAGFFEGEGSFSDDGHVRITQVTRWPLDRVREVFGGRVIQYETDAINGRISVFCWYATGARARGIAMTMYSLLSPRRQLQARRMLKVSRLSDPPQELIPSAALLRRLVERHGL